MALDKLASERHPFRMLISIAVIIIIAAVLLLVARKSSDFSISREVRIMASPETIFPHINDREKMSAWNPWFKEDPPPKLTFSGPTQGVGSTCSWKGKKAGVGSVTVTESVPNQKVVSKLTYVKPFAGTQTAEFSLTPDGQGTVMKWSARGKSSFIPRLVCTLINIDMEKMVGGTFQKGLDDLKSRIETQQ